MEASTGYATSPRRQEGALGPYLRAIRAHRLVVALITLLALAAAAFWVQHRAPTYEATAEILLNALPQTDQTYLGLQVLRDANDETRTAQTAASLIDSPQAAILTAQRLGRGFTRASVSSAISVQPQGQSNILTVTAQAPDATTAARLANVFAQSSLDARRDELDREVALQVAGLQGDNSSAGRTRLAQLRRLQGRPDPALSLSQQAVTPGGPTGTAKWLILALAALAGFTLASATALLLEAVDHRVRDPEDLLALYPLPVLARVPKLPRRQRRRRSGDALAMPPVVREAFRSVTIQLDDRGGPRRTIMFTSASSGDGKTNSALNMALALVAAGQRVIVMDFDLRKPDLGRLAGVGGSAGLVSLLGSDRALADILVPFDRLPSLSVAPAGTGEGDMLLLGALARRLPAIIAEARELADTVIIDTPPLGEVADALRVAGEVDEIVLVARPGNTNRHGLEEVRDLLTRSGHIPAGLIIVGAPGQGKSSYYAYGGVSGGRRRRFTLARGASA